MYYIRQHISAILSTYSNELPLAHFLKQYFKKYPILGSRDRKLLSAMTYSFYRSSKGISGDSLTLDQLVDISLLLCDNKPVPVQRILPDDLKSLAPAEDSAIITALNDRGISFDNTLNFFADLKFSEGITKEQWTSSLLRQPRLFIRLIDKHKKKVVRQLNDAGIEFKEVNENCLSLPNGTPVDKLLKPDAYRVQDLSSQQTAEFFKTSKKQSWWDACCGAGGKSLLLKELEPSVNLSVSDVRESMLENLSERFFLYGFQHPQQYLLSAADSEETKKAFGTELFDSIICDVPCSGSGTWARTPEQFYFFNPEVLVAFHNKQFSIASNALNHLKPGGMLYYITCSVFTEENDSVINRLIENGQVRLEKKELINGLDQHADSLFIALLKKEPGNK